MELWVCHLGRVEYREAAALQERLRERVSAGELPELMLLLEHPPVYTVGRRSDEDELPFGEAFYRERGIDIVRTPRGGQLTYHGPGQLVGYPIMRVGSVPEYILTMERSIVAALADAGLEAGTKLGHKHVGVWVGERKIASVGVHISHGVSAPRLRGQRRQRPRPVQLGRRVRAARGADDLAAGRGHRRGRRLLPQADGLPLQRGVRPPPAARERRRGWASRRPCSLMDVGLAIFLTGERSTPPSWPSGPRTRGYESLMVTEHTHIPVSARDGGARRRPAATRTTAARTTRSSRSRSPPRRPSSLIVGTSVCLVIEHDPIVLAKQIASLQNLSGGRFVFGVGAGWNKHEMLNHGTDPATRHGNMRERVEAMKAIWADDEAEYHGKHVDFDPIWQWPKPRPRAAGAHRRQRPAGRGPRPALRRRLDAEHEGARDARRRGSTALRERAGRHVPVTYYGATPENLDALREAGVDRALIVLESGPSRPSIPSLSERRARPAHPPNPLARQPGRDGRHEGAGRGRPALPHAQARVVQGPAPRQPEVPRAVDRRSPTRACTRSARRRPARTSATAGTAARPRS